MTWDIYAEHMNEVILKAIEHGGDSGGPYLCCSKELFCEMEQLLQTMCDFSKHYRVGYIYINEFLAEVPQFVKL